MKKAVFFLFITFLVFSGYASAQDSKSFFGGISDSGVSDYGRNWANKKRYNVGNSNNSRYNNPTRQDNTRYFTINKRKTPNAGSIGKKYAILIGQNYYPSRPLKTCINDAKIMGYILRNQMQFKANNIRYIFDRKMSKQALANVLYRLSRMTKDNDLIVFFYSGHGGRGYMILWNHTRLWGHEVARLFKNIKGNILFVYDMCHADGFSQQYMRVRTNKGKTYHFASSMVSQKSYCAHTYSRFTLYFQKSVLDGKADTNRDSKISLRESYNWTKNKLIQYAKYERGGRYQTPVLRGDNPDYLFLNQKQATAKKRFRTEYDDGSSNTYGWDMYRGYREQARSRAARAGVTLKEKPWIKNRDLFSVERPERYYNFAGPEKSPEQTAEFEKPFIKTLFE